jgi:hypothetical protein
MHPQKRTSGFLLIKYVALENPLGCTMVMSLEGNVMMMDLTVKAILKDYLRADSLCHCLSPQNDEQR